MKKNEINNIDHILEFLGNPKNEFYLWGIGETGQTFYKKYKDHIKIKGFIDSNAVPGQTLFDLPVYPASQFKFSEDTKIIITIITPVYVKEVTDTLLKYGLTEHIHFIKSPRAEQGINYLFAQKIYLSVLELIITSRCTLNCRDCIQLTPQYSKTVFCTLDEIKQQVDMIFQTVDFCNEFHIVGGEPLLHADLDKIITYVYTNYKDKFSYLCVVTNGTILPSEQLLNTLKKSDTHVEISDYSVSFDADKKQKMQIIIDMLSEANVPFVIRKWATWVDFNGDGKPHSDEEIIQTMENCLCALRVFYMAGGRLYTCTRYGAAEHFGLIPRQEGNSLKLLGDNPPSKKEILEWCMGICETGYLPCCKLCTGDKLIFERVIPVAVQQERKP